MKILGCYPPLWLPETPLPCIQNVLPFFESLTLLTFSLKLSTVSLLKTKQNHSFALFLLPPKLPPLLVPTLFSFFPLAFTASLKVVCDLLAVCVHGRRKKVKLSCRAGHGRNRLKVGRCVTLYGEGGRVAGAWKRRRVTGGCMERRKEGWRLAWNEPG